MCDAAMMSGPRSMSRSLLINAADRFRRLGPPRMRAWEQFRHLQKASGKAFAAAVPRKVMVIFFGQVLPASRALRSELPGVRLRVVYSGAKGAIRGCNPA